MRGVLVIFLVLCLCSVPLHHKADASTREIVVSAAISLKNAFEEIGRSYEQKNRGTKVVFNFGPSGDLIRQVEAGAPVDVFASASQKEMDEIETKGLIVAGSRKNFAGNTLVLVVPRRAHNKVRAFSDLKSDLAKRIAAGNPRTVPAGRYAEEIFEYYGIINSLRSRLVYAGNVRQVLDYTARGEVDAGVVYKTDALARPDEVEIVSEAPIVAHEPVIYPIAAVKGAGSEVAAKAFISLVTSAEGKRILERYGFRAAM